MLAPNIQRANERYETVTEIRTSGGKLNQSQVDLIRQEYEMGKKSQRDLAREFGVTRKHIIRILRGKTWSEGATQRWLENKLLQRNLETKREVN